MPRWQWIDNTYGPRGWLSAKEKRKHEGTAEFQDGMWRKVSDEEAACFARYVSRLYHEQS